VSVQLEEISRKAAGGTKMERWEMSREIIWENKLRSSIGA
jgi:hypothetical protein